MLKNILVFGILAFSVSNAETLVDSKKYHPKNTKELFKLVRDSNINLGDIDTSKITDMSYLFAELKQDECDDAKKNYNDKVKNFKENLNINLDEAKSMINNLLESCKYKPRLNFGGIEIWNVSNVRNMSGMFDGADTFNKPLNFWNVSNVRNMNGMFYGAVAFNRPLDSWDTSKVVNMAYMFAGAKSFNQPLSSWDTSNVNNMSGMFLSADSFNQPLNSWNVSNVTNMAYMFAGAISFNQPLNSWNISKVEDMSFMFASARLFNQSLDSWGDKLKSDCKLDSMFDVSPLASNQPKWYKNK